MKTAFPEFQGYSSDEFQKLFDECTFVFDTNVLLNLYKYSTETKNELLEILHKIEDRLWMPHQVGLEYNFNRLSVISDQEKFYNKLISSIEKDFGSFINGLAKDYNKKHPYIKWDEIKNQLDNCIENITNNIVEKKEKHPNLLGDDEILTEINKLFENKIGEAYSQEKLDGIYKEGKDRYSRKCPPGYKDLKEKQGQFKDYGGVSYKDEYGDLVMWYQIIDYAKNKNQSIIFITDDTKEDWWREKDGKTIGPRIELLNEFRVKAEVGFYMYRTDSFMKRIRKYLKQTVNNEAIEEVREVSEDYSKRGIEHTLHSPVLEKLYESDVLSKYKESNFNINKLLYVPTSEFTKKLKLDKIHDTEITIKRLIREIWSNTPESNRTEIDDLIDDILSMSVDDNMRISRLKNLKNMVEDL